LYKLLIVDDEYEIRIGLSNYFPWNDMGFEVVGQAENGKSALEFITKNDVDIILCDIKMPIMSGIDLAKEIYNNRMNVKVIFLSGYKDFGFAQEAIKYGVKNYIVKPTKYSEIVEVFSGLKNELDKDYLHSEVEKEMSSNPQGFNLEENVIATVKAYVQKDYKDATLEEAAKLAYMNPYYLSKYFKEKTGTNFSDYLIDVKMKKAAELLKNIAYKTYDISEIVGYQNPKNFTRAFKKFFGKSPSEYRHGPVSGSSNHNSAERL
jgi:two-component system, response regulator YesN